MSEKSPQPDDAREPDPDATREGPDLDRTVASDADATQVGGPAPWDDDEDATRAFGRTDPDATRVTPASDAWMGRAEVRPSDPVRGAVPPEDGEEWNDTDQEEPGRRWWLPVLLGLLGVLVVLAIICGIMLVTRDSGNDNPTPAPTRTLGPTATAPASPSAARTATASPSAPPTATTVLVPETQGDSQAQATGKLQALGLIVHVTFQEDPVATPGTVLASVPTAGSVVPSGSEITLIIVKALQSSPPSPVPASTRPAPELSVTPGPVTSPN